MTETKGWKQKQKRQEKNWKKRSRQRNANIYAGRMLLFLMAVGGMFLYAENRCAQVAELVAERGVPTADAVPWMEASDYTIRPLDREPKGYHVTVFTWLPARPEIADGLRT